MGKKGRIGVLKRQREAKKAEKAALKRERRELRRDEGGPETEVATQDDLAGYGLIEEEEEAVADQERD